MTITGRQAPAPRRPGVWVWAAAAWLVTACAEPRSGHTPDEDAADHATPALSEGALRATGAPLIVSLTFDDTIDDIERKGDDEDPNRPEDDLAQAVGSPLPQLYGVLTDGDDIPNESRCDFVGDRVGDPRQSNEQIDCDLPATFYLNWPRLGETSQGFLSYEKVREMVRWGHEIGGHSSHHHEVAKLESASLSALDLTEQRLQMCWDRQNLSGMLRDPANPSLGNLTITTFAYPLGNYAWQGDAKLTSPARFDAAAPALGPWDTRDIAGHSHPGECGYRAARQTRGAANTSACIDGDPSTDCNWAERIVTLPDGGVSLANANDTWAVRAATSVEFAQDHVIDPNPDKCTSLCCRVPACCATQRFALRYPSSPCNDEDGDGKYSTEAEYESRAQTLMGWVDNALVNVNRAPPGQKNWIIFTFHSLCATRGCNKYGIYWEDFRDLLKWLRQKQKSGQISVQTVADVLGFDRELPVTVPALPAQPTAVRNGSLAPYPGGDLNRDYLPDCFSQSGPNSNVALADALQAPAGGGTSVAGAVGTPSYAWLWLEKGTATGRFYTRQDHGQCALKVTAGNRYRVSFWYRQSDAARRCPYQLAPTSSPCPLAGTAVSALAASPLAGEPENPNVLPFGFRGVDDGADADSTDGPLVDSPPAVQGVVAASVTAPQTPLYSMLYTFRRQQVTGSSLKDGHWGQWGRISLADLSDFLPSATWKRAQVDLPVAIPTGMDSLSFGVEVVARGALGVRIDLDELSYCRLPGGTVDAVPVCPL